MGIRRKPSQTMAHFHLLLFVFFAVIYVGSVIHGCQGLILGPFAIGLLVFKTVVEVAASFYGIAFLLSAITYLFPRGPFPASEKVFRNPSVGIVYLCCDDLDREAMESFTKLRYPGKLLLIVHDDSNAEQTRSDVKSAAKRMRSSGVFADVILLRRPRKEGGKAGALNYVLEQTGHLYEYFLLCDNDSTVLDPLSIEKALPYFEEEHVAIVQCRTIGIDSPDYCAVNRLLVQSIDAFHVFLTSYSRFGWQPFVGHNAFLRTRAIQKVGGFTPGFFSAHM